MLGEWSLRWFASRAAFLDECNSAREMFLRALASPGNAQKSFMDDLYNICGTSQSWQREKYLDRIKNGANFREIVPIRPYADFEGLIDEEIHAKGGVLSNSPVCRWLKTSGTTGRPKRIPYTLHWMTKYRVPAMRAMWGTFLNQCPELLAHPHATFDTQTVRESASQYVLGVPYQGISNRNPPLSGGDWVPPWYDAPWYVPTIPTDHLTKMYFRLRFLVSHDVRFLTAINPSTIVSLFDSIGLFADTLLRELSDGTIGGAKISNAEPETARRLEKIFSRASYSLNDIWPNLTCYSTWASAAAKLYGAQIEQILPLARRVPFMSCGTEAVVTIPLDDSQESQPLAINQGFYEFLPAEEDPEAYLNGEKRSKTLLFDQLDSGKEYQIIISQANGMIRLYTGDVFLYIKVAAEYPIFRSRAVMGCIIRLQAKSLPNLRSSWQLNAV